MKSPLWSGQRRQARHASLRRDGTGLRRFQGRCCRARLATLTFTLASLPLSVEERKGKGATGSERILATFHTMVARARYETHEKCEFLIMRSEFSTFFYDSGSIPANERRTAGEERHSEGQKTSQSVA